ncbi:MAG: TonB family protein [Candidatus Melainabacteria bacterium]|nr:TonB family protein [Candidatus Melainabacteria bacterium]
MSEIKTDVCGSRCQSPREKEATGPVAVKLNLRFLGAYQMNTSSKLGRFLAVSLSLCSLQVSSTSAEKLYRSNSKHVRQLAQRVSGTDSKLQPNDDARLFERDKGMREFEKYGMRGRVVNHYVSLLKSILEKSWHPPQHSGLLVTTRAITLNQAGIITEKKVVAERSSMTENESVDAALAVLSFPALPSDFDKLELVLTFMSDGANSKVEVKEPEPLRTARRPAVDFGPYMDDLQRRIKRAWFPPKGYESKRVVVVFKILKGGELDHLRLDRSSGVAVADQAALKAVENAAPFHPLPENSPDPLEIQFTFDFDRFAGGGRGVFWQH